MESVERTSLQVGEMFRMLDKRGNPLSSVWVVAHVPPSGEGYDVDDHEYICLASGEVLSEGEIDYHKEVLKEYENRSIQYFEDLPDLTLGVAICPATRLLDGFHSIKRMFDELMETEVHFYLRLDDVEKMIVAEEGGIPTVLQGRFNYLSAARSKHEAPILIEFAPE